MFSVPTLVEQIYEAAFIPDMWVDVIDGFVAAANGDSGAIIILPRGMQPRAHASPRVMGERMDLWLSTGDWRGSPRIGKAIEIAGEGFLPIEQLMTEQELVRDSVRKGFDQAGVGHQLCMSVLMPSDEVVAFTVERRLDKGGTVDADVAALNELRPHLARAGLLAARLGLEFARTMVGVIEALGLPGAVFNRSGRVIAANKLLEERSSSFVPIAGGGIVLSSSAATARLRAAMEVMASGSSSTVSSIAVPPTETDAAMVVHLVPLRRGARDLFVGAEFMLVASTVDHSAVPEAALLRGLFDLTPAEARLAQQVAAGRQLPDLPGEMGVSITTLRTQLRSIFSKTGTSRQTELVRLLSAVRLGTTGNSS